MAVLRLALYYSVVPLRSAHKLIPYEDSKRMCQSNQIDEFCTISKVIILVAHGKHFQGDIADLQEILQIIKCLAENHNSLPVALFFISNPSYFME